MASPPSSLPPSGTVEPSGAELELYRLAVEMADRVSARRGTANGFFVAVNAALMTAVGVLHPAAATSGERSGSDFGPMLVSLAGVALAATWWLALRSYRDLSRAKFEVITAIEDRLPVALFRDEWRLLKVDPVRSWRGRYAELGQVERVVPLLFIGLYVASIAGLILGW